MDGPLPTHVVQGERNWCALWWWRAVGRVNRAIVFSFICIYMQEMSQHPVSTSAIRWFIFIVCFLWFQVLKLFSGWSRIWTSKIKVKELISVDLWDGSGFGSWSVIRCWSCSVDVTQLMEALEDITQSEGYDTYIMTFRATYIFHHNHPRLQNNNHKTRNG